jgi:hypothetical protein
VRSPSRRGRQHTTVRGSRAATTDLGLPPQDPSSNTRTEVPAPLCGRGPPPPRTKPAAAAVGEPEERAPTARVWGSRPGRPRRATHGRF